MDYSEIISRAWRITWRYKWLWVLGVFAGGGSRGSVNYQSNYGSSGSSGTNPFDTMPTFPELGGGTLLLIALAFALLAVVMLVFAVLGVAARGGLIAQVDRADGGIAPSLREGWRVGFRYFWRTFGIGLALMGPVFVFIIAAVVVAILVIAGSAATGSDAAIVGGVGGFCGIIALMVVILIPASIILGVLHEMALRYAILEDRPWSNAIATAWAAMRARTGPVAATWAITLGIGIVAGIAMGIVGAIALVPLAIGAFAAYEGGDAGTLIWLIVAVAIFLTPVFLLMSAVLNTMTSSLWTVFWRRLHGKVADQEAMALYPVAPPLAPTPPVAEQL